MKDKKEEKKEEKKEVKDVVNEVKKTNKVKEVVKEVVDEVKNTTKIDKVNEKDVVEDVEKTKTKKDVEAKKTKEENEGCCFVITRGKNKGFICGKKCKNDNYCKLHTESVNKPNESDKSESVIKKLQEILGITDSTEDAILLFDSQKIKTELSQIIKNNTTNPTNLTNSTNPTNPTKSVVKRTKSAYMFFSQHIRPIIKSELDISSKEIMTEIGKRWKELSLVDKKPFEKLAKDCKENIDNKDDEKDQKNKDEKPKKVTAYSLFRTFTPLHI